MFKVRQALTVVQKALSKHLSSASWCFHADDQKLWLKHVTIAGLETHISARGNHDVAVSGLWLPLLHSNSNPATDSHTRGLGLTGTWGPKKMTKMSPWMQGVCVCALDCKTDVRYSSC